ncbi:MAG TPA: CGNR zinc finger domain-containing protein [Pseudonocardia sp.]|nr:CGNR zinc finger domain-containing protein [Pseudonocardia sp.]
MEFPILGTEPLPVELANTIYLDDGEVTDFLATTELVTAWFAAADGAPLAASAAVPARELRDCVRAVLTAAVDGRVPDPTEIEALNRYAAGAARYPQLSWGADGVGSEWVDCGGGVTARLGRIAAATIELLVAEPDVRRCPGPGCSMLFVRDHARRRFCHGSCGHRDRQARYYRRQRAITGY